MSTNSGVDNTYISPPPYMPLPGGFGAITPTGWQCPVCRHVYSPNTPVCLYCPVKVETTTSTNKTAGRSQGDAGEERE